MKANISPELQEIIDLLNGPEAHALRYTVDEYNVYEVISDLLQDYSELIAKLEEIHTASDF